MGAPSVRVLGDLAIDGLQARSFADRKARLLLRLLALARGRGVTSDALAEAIWGAAAPARPHDQVAVLVSRLRRELGRESIEYGDEGYRLRYGWLDVDELSTLITEAEQRRERGNLGGAVAACRVAMALVRGPLPELPTDAAWAQADRDAAVRLVQRARRTTAMTLLEAGDWLDALDLAAADLREDPYDEQAARHLMQAHLLAGRPGAALAVFADLRAVLADELGADPAPETQALHQAALRGESPAAPVAETRARIVGRERQLARLDAAADDDTTPGLRILSVLGEAGIGKTTLVTTWARRRTENGDTVLFGTCGALDRASPLDVLFGVIGEQLRRAPDDLDLLGEQRPLLAPLLGLPAAVAPAGPAGPAQLDPVLGPSALYAALTTVLGRIAATGRLILVIDDAHLAGEPLADWARFALRRSAPLLLVAAARAGEGTALPATEVITLGPLDARETAELVGPGRAAELFRRSGGHPLFLSELANSRPEPGAAVPPSLVAAVEQRCDQLGEAAGLLRAGAILGTRLDLDLLASILARPTLEVLADAELAEDRQLLVENGGRYSFRHELVREALAAGTRTSRAALLHREAGRILAQRPDADPIEVAEHARLGGDLTQAARSLRLAAARAAERFDHATAEDLLDQSLALEADDATLLERARVRTRRGRYAEAELDVLAAGSGADAWEVGAWASYFDRRFDDAVRFAHDGELGAHDPAVRARCLTVGGRTLHARGDLAGAERKLTAAVAESTGADLITAAAWLGVLHSHRSEVDRALELLGPVTRPGTGVELTSATLHAWLFTGHAHALAGRPDAALAAFAHYTEEVDRRQVPRFSGRGVNMAGWVLRNVGAAAAAVDAHQQALDLAVGKGRVEMRIAALEDLAEERLRTEDPDGAGSLLDQAAALFGPDLVFGWRLELKLALLRARCALVSGQTEEGREAAVALHRDALRLGVPRYGSVARLLIHRADAALGVPVDPEAAGRDLAAVEDAVRLEAWWWAGETGAALGWEPWIRRAETLADDLAARSGRYADELRAEADRRLSRWRLSIR